MMYKIGRFIVYIMTYMLYKLTVIGKENIPKTGSALICPNHLSNYDPLAVACITSRAIHYMAKAELFKNPLLGWFLRKVYAFPVNRDEVSIDTIKTSLKILKNQELLGIFPEGKRVNSDERIQPASGFVVFAIKTKSPIIPVRIRGDFKFRHRIEIIVGKPIYLTEYYGKKISEEDAEALGKKILDDLYELKQNVVV
ncbi:MAG: lysophospholipid acyltransferase family protein [Acetobacterium sp.]